LYNYLELGEVHLVAPLTKEKRHELAAKLHVSGLELIENKTAILIEKIKNIIIEMVYSDELPDVKYSVFISEKMQKDYHVLADLFSKTKGTTIEHFIIIHKIERAKELIMYDELNLSEIAYKLNYSSVAHLSNQFKKITGLTPSFFKKMPQKKRINLEDL
ncbi:MAG: helix-turn-helix domain-containing protein, partial [Chitinophagaceae bacterium]